jgi:exosortase A-associated hydrolase 1
MSELYSHEVPLVFECAGETLVGVVHKPLKPASIGVVTIIAGGPQYRGGVGRGMVSAARELSSAGVAVMRFDHRGLGDSSGRFLGFEHIGEDIQAAVTAFHREVPEVTSVVLWGGCDAASAAMIHGWKITGVTSMVLGNPWVTTAETQTIVLRKHYLSRLGEWSFWKKLLRMEYKLSDYFGSAWKKLVLRQGEALRASALSGSPTTDAGMGNYVVRMLDGLQRFRGPVLFLMSGQSLLSREFDELVNAEPKWRAVYHRSNYKRIDFPAADQTFSDSDSRQGVNRAICEWLLTLSAK